MKEIEETLKEFSKFYHTLALLEIRRKTIEDCVEDKVKARIEENEFWYNQFNNFQVSLSPYNLGIFESRIDELKQQLLKENDE